MGDDGLPMRPLGGFALGSIWVEGRPR
eukprot:SAG11_NODE_15097_length_589_cov_0.957143_1_plen_26_part_10